MVLPISKRSEFMAVTSSEVQSTSAIPSPYAWMRQGTSFVFRGQMIEGHTDSEWGLEINYVNDLSGEGKPSPLGYTVFFARGEHLQNWLSWPTLFPHFFNMKVLGYERIQTSLGTFRCLKLVRGPENYCGVNKHLWYHDLLGCLMKMEVKSIDDSKAFYQCSLAEVSKDVSTRLASNGARNVPVPEDIPSISTLARPQQANDSKTPHPDRLRASIPQVDANLQEASQAEIARNLESQLRSGRKAAKIDSRESGRWPRILKRILWGAAIAGVIATVAYITNRGDDSASQGAATPSAAVQTPTPDGASDSVGESSYRELLAEEALIPVGGREAFGSAKDLKAALKARSGLVNKCDKALRSHQITRAQYESLMEVNRGHLLTQSDLASGITPSSGPLSSDRWAQRREFKVVIKPLRTEFGVIYGAEARDQTSGTLLATAKQVAMEGQTLVVEEMQYSPSGDVIYRGKLFFSEDNELLREEPVAGTKRWNIFRTWIEDRPY